MECSKRVDTKQESSLVELINVIGNKNNNIKSKKVHKQKKCDTEQKKLDRHFLLLNCVPIQTIIIMKIPIDSVCCCEDRECFIYTYKWCQHKHVLRTQ